MINHIRYAEPGDHVEDAHDCPGPELELSAYIDGELPTEQRQALEVRLVTDTTTRSRIDELTRVQALVRLAYRAIPDK